MSVKQIIEHLEKIYQLQKSLLSISKEKTELIKANKIEQFNELLMTERKHVQAIDQLEKKRIDATNDWFDRVAPDAERTISGLIEHVTDEADRKQLEKLYEEMIYVLADLKQQEKLNLDLTQQSLQFIELSLDMFQPNSTKNMNYNQPNSKQGKKSSTSVFDSKA
ncbi:flagellar protein FlgN [Bacillaceae bacterium W0354]